MKQEDIFIAVSAYLPRRTPILRWVFPIRIIRVKLLFDVYCWVFVSNSSGLDFSGTDNMEPDEFISWAIYGGAASYQASKNRKTTISPEMAERIRQGLLVSTRDKILETIIGSREIGESAQAYQAAMVNPEDKDEDGVGKKPSGSAPRS